ncbi:MAG: adenylate/guanylate cyclase domain-containing protein [Thermaerobacterales bacterium]
MQPQQVRRLSLVLSLCLLAVGATGLWGSAERGIYDAFFRIRGPQNPGNDVVIVAVDERSIQALGPFPWDRDVHARLLDQLAPARVVAFDLVFDFPRQPESDRAFAEAMTAHGGVVLASFFTFEQDADGWRQDIRRPAAEFAHAAAGTGYINIPADRGNTVRTVVPADTNLFGRPYPSFALAAALTAHSLTPDDLHLGQSLLTAGPIAIPLNRNQETLPHFWGPQGAFATYSYLDVLTGRIAAELWQQRIVLVGIVTPTQPGDYFETPYTADNLILTGSLPSPGVEIHASAVQSYLDNHYFRRAPAWVNLLAALGLWAAGWGSGRRLGMVTGLIPLVALTVGAAGMAYAAWFYLHLWLDLIFPVTMTVAGYLGAAGVRLVETEREKRNLHDLFHRYVSPQVIEEMTRRNEPVTLGGQYREVTLLFVDVRNFSRFSEGRDPQEVVNRLNEIFEIMTRAIFRHQGTLDKYLGDGLMAVFGAPVAYAGHGVRALAAVREIMHHLSDLERRAESSDEIPLVVHFGLHSGTAIVGNMGSTERMEYTAIGETVNLAARLQSLNRALGTTVLMTRETVQNVRRHEASYFSPEAGGQSATDFQSLGEHSIQGLSKPVPLFTLAMNGAKSKSCSST